jgi:hypothetical protein
MTAPTISPRRVEPKPIVLKPAKRIERYVAPAQAYEAPVENFQPYEYAEPTYEAPR